MVPRPRRIRPANRLAHAWELTYIAIMKVPVPIGPLAPPPGRPSWGGGDALSLIYLGWGKRDFARYPLAAHYDNATSYHVLLRGDITVKTQQGEQIVQAPAAMIFDPECVFGFTQSVRKTTEILAWIWRERAIAPELQPKAGQFLSLKLGQRSLKPLIELHKSCRNEVLQADTHVSRTLQAFRELLEVELLRGGWGSAPSDDVKWRLANAWMLNNLSIHAPVPALCDYLGMSPSTLHRYFLAQCGRSPGVHFRQLKLREAQRLIKTEGWQVKAASYQLGYRHANDLSRALANLSMSTESHNVVLPASDWRRLGRSTSKSKGKIT